MKDLKTLFTLVKFDRSEEFIYHAKGRKRSTPQFKVLFTNCCENNCLYCINRRSRNTPRYSFTPELLTKTFLELRNRGRVKGLFLSSGIHHSAVRTMEKMISTVEMVRKCGFNDFVHLKVLPGVDDSLIEKAIEVADRISINLEAVSPYFLKKIAREKSYSALMRKLYIAHKIRKTKRKKVGIATQIIVGGTGESDRDILYLVRRLIKDINIQMLYFSSFHPVKDTPMENHPPESKKRELRLYRAFFLLKEYGISPEYLSFDRKGNLLYDDPKEGIVLKMGVKLPVEVNKAPLEILKLIPGINRNTAKKIVSIRREGKFITPLLLLKTGVKRRALNYLLINGTYYGNHEQLSIF